MKVGFTGTRNGVTDAQGLALHRLLDELCPTVFLHGACLGADEYAVVAVRLWAVPMPAEVVAGTDIAPRPARPVRIVALPGVSAWSSDLSMRSRIAVEHSDEVRPATTHFARNRTIVEETDLLIGCPGVSTWGAKGGTFYTMGYAIKKGKPVKIIWPDGRIEGR